MQSRRISFALIVAFVAWAMLSPATLSTATHAALAFCSKNFSWLYLWLVFSMVVLCLCLAFGRFGNIRLGDDDEEPAFSRGSWFAMLFAAGMGIGLVFWGVAEPLSHFLKPPPGVIAQTADAAGAAMRYTFFHWGVHPWAMYSIVALAIAFAQFRLGKPSTIEATLSGLPQWLQGRWHAAIDVLATLATAFGVATSLGMGALQINSGLARVFDAPISPTTQIAIIVITTAIFITSSMSGVERGIKWLSNINLVLALLFALTVFIIGPTVAILDTFTNTLGGYVTELVRMSLRLTPFRNDPWVTDWTVFYWAWWISWSPFVGMFIARVSRGRTIREFVIGAMLVPSLVSFMWFSVFGGTALNQEIFGTTPLAAKAVQDASVAMFDLFATLPLTTALSVVAIVLVSIFFITSGDSATFVLGMLSDNGNPHPSTRLKLGWGVLVALIAISLLLVGGLEAIQTATIVIALPFAIVIALMAYSLWRELAQEADRMEKAERELRRKIRKLI
ncbi:BCCT family transporter [Uliginosibacterium sp. sgz301328]|uniref:BCCT family transporter n=1 Tax=Uliginosibacterium sp. sgz301328 TaxID=3243764 RepID=UPI00359E2D3A